MIGDTLYKEPQANLEWLRRAPSTFWAFLSELRDSEVRQLKNADEPRHIYRAQGRLEIIDRILGLQVELQKMTPKASKGASNAVG